MLPRLAGLVEWTECAARIPSGQSLQAERQPRKRPGSAQALAAIGPTSVVERGDSPVPVVRLRGGVGLHLMGEG